MADIGAVDARAGVAEPVEPGFGEGSTHGLLGLALIAAAVGQEHQLREHARAAQQRVARGDLGDMCSVVIGAHGDYRVVARHAGSPDVLARASAAFDAREADAPGQHGQSLEHRARYPTDRAERGHKVGHLARTAQQRALRRGQRLLLRRRKGYGEPRAEHAARLQIDRGLGGDVGVRERAERLAVDVCPEGAIRVRGETEPAAVEAGSGCAPDEQRAVDDLGREAEPPVGRVRLVVGVSREHGLKFERERAVERARGGELDYAQLGRVPSGHAGRERARDPAALAVEAQQPAVQLVHESALLAGQRLHRHIAGIGAQREAQSRRRRGGRTVEASVDAYAAGAGAAEPVLRAQHAVYAVGDGKGLHLVHGAALAFPACDGVGPQPLVHALTVGAAAQKYRALGRALAQQRLICRHLRLAHEAPAHYPVEQEVGSRDEAHTQVVRHDAADGLAALAGAAAGREIHRLP